MMRITRGIMAQDGTAYRSLRGASMLVLVAGMAAVAPAALAQDAARGGSSYPQPDPEKDGTTKYVVSKFLLEYEYNNEEHPALAELFALPVTVGVLSDGGYTTPDAKVHPGIPTAQITVGEAFGDKGQVFYPGGIAAVNEAIARELVARRSLIGVRVIAHPEDISLGTGDDLRAADNRRMRLKIFTAQLGGTEVLDQSTGVDAADRKNPERLERIRESSPLNVGGLIRRDRLDDYVLRLNRHPGRRVNVALVPASEKPGEVELQYQVSEVKPWSIYAQVANIGTKSTDEWRERIGFAHTQVTDNDDILRLDFLTAGFSDTNSIYGSYERPFFDHALTLKVFGSWSQYSADQVGISGLEFTGDSWSAGAELAWTVFQTGANFVDLVGGVRYENVSVNNKLLLQEGQESFVIPSFGARYSRTTDNMSTNVSGIFDLGLGSLTGANTAELTKLGRIFPDKNWIAFKFDAEHSMYLEPLFYSTAYKDKDPNRLRGATLAHEVSLGFRGQYGFDYRLIPQASQTLGGLFSVRGYDQSVAVVLHAGQ